MRWFSHIPTVVIVIAFATFTFITFSNHDQAAMMNKMAPTENIEVAKHYIALLRNHQYDLIAKDLDPSIKTSNVRATLAQMEALIPPQEPTSVTVVGSQTYKVITNGKTSITANIALQYEFPDKWLLINVATTKTETGTSVTNFNVNPIADSLENMNRFSLSGKKPLHYLILALAIIIPIFIVYTLVLCVQTKMGKRKWLWVLFILFGIGQFRLNWTTGQWWLSPLSIQTFGANAFAPLFGAWMLSVSVPAGAIAFLLRRKKLIESHADSLKASTPEVTD